MPFYCHRNSSWSIDFLNKLFENGLNSDYLPNRITVSFIVKDDGIIVGARLLTKESLSLEYQHVIIDVLEHQNKWIPGRHNGVNVNVILTRVIHIDPRDKI